MGQEVSCACPCRNRKEQQERLTKSKYDPDALDIDNAGFLMDPDRRAKIEESKKLQELISRRDSSKQNLGVKRSGSSMASPSKTNDSEGDYEDDDIDMIFLGVKIESMANSMNEISQQYSHMVPYVIVPHPAENKAVIALKYVEAKGENDKPIHYKMFHFEKDLKSLNNNISYGVLEDFFKQQYNNGLDFLGYYLDFDYKYHLIFSNIGAKRERTHLDFQKLNDTSLKEIKNVLKKRASMGYEFKGMITLIETYETPKPLSFMVFEKKTDPIGETILVDIAASTFANEGPNIEFSRKVDNGCLEDNMRVTGVLSIVRDETLYLVFNK